MVWKEREKKVWWYFVFRTSYLAMCNTSSKASLCSKVKSMFYIATLIGLLLPTLMTPVKLLMNFGFNPTAKSEI